MELKVLVACEESQAVTKELRKLGHEAYSCDIEPESGGHPEWHIQRDVLPLLNGFCEFKTVDGVLHKIKSRWNMIIAFPPCTHLAVSGAAWFEEKRKDGRQQQGIDFFMAFVNCDCEKVVIENPIGIMSSKWRKPDQIIQPWMFGHMEQKKTCLWLIGGVSPLQETNNVYKEMMLLPKNKRERLHYLPPSTERAKLRSKTFPEIAKAMATQWCGEAKDGEE